MRVAEVLKAEGLSGPLSFGPCLQFSLQEVAAELDDDLWVEESLQIN